MIKPKYLVVLCGFAFFTMLAFVSTGINYGNAAPAVASAIAPAPNQPINCSIGAPAGSVVGAVTVGTPLYYAADTQSQISGAGPLVPGSKWFVVGQDATHKFYKIYISCGFAWIPVGTIGPSPDAPNAGAPLPGGVVS